MKNTLLTLPLLLLSFLIKAQDIKNFIPENTNFIVKVNGARINNNVDFDAIRSTEMYKDLLFKMIDHKTAEQRAFVKLLETPDETGLNIKTDMYAYDIPEVVSTRNTKTKKQKYDYDYYDYEDETYEEPARSTIVLAIPLLNSTKFSHFIKDLFYKNNKAKISKASKGVYYIKNYNTLIIWNSDKVFFCTLPYRSYYQKAYSTGDIKSAIASIIKPKTSSIINNSKILNGLGFDADIAYAFNANSFKNLTWAFNKINEDELIKDSTLFDENLFKDHYSFSYANFEKGKIVFTGNQFYSEKLAAIINPIFNLKPSAKLANIVYQAPVTSYISYAFSFTEMKKFAEKTFNYNMDTLLIEYVKSSQNNVFETDSTIRAYRKEIDTIDFIVNGPDKNMYQSDLSVITDSGTVYDDEVYVEPYYDYDSYDSYGSDEAKYEHETLNWYQLDSLSERQDTLYEMIYARKDTLALTTYQSLGIKGDEVWNIFNGEFIVLYHAMTSVEKKSKVYEIDEEYNYVEVEKVKKVPMPLFSVAMTINSDSLFNKYLKLLVDKGFIQKEKNRYLVVFGDMNEYIWVHNGVCILTNDNNLNPTIPTNSASKSGYETDNFTRITSHQSGAHIEVGKILASSVQFVDDKETAEVLEILAKYFDETTYYTNFNSELNISSKSEILFNDEQKNSINILVDMMEEIYVHFTKK
jgi:hypothetical protein